MRLQLTTDLRSYVSVPVQPRPLPKRVPALYASQTKAELLSIARDRDLQVSSNARKAEVIEALEQDDAA